MIIYCNVRTVSKGFPFSFEWKLSLKKTLGVFSFRSDDGATPDPCFMPGVTAEVLGTLDDRTSCNILASSPPHDGVPQSVPV